MKENIIDVLLYLFENYIDTEESSQKPDKDALELELEREHVSLGFSATVMLTNKFWKQEFCMNTLSGFS